MAVLEVNRNVLPEPGFLIGGEKVTSGSDDPFPHRYAANGEVTNEVPMAGAKEVDAARSKTVTASDRISNDIRAPFSIRATHFTRGRRIVARYRTVTPGASNEGVTVKREVDGVDWLWRARKD